VVREGHEYGGVEHSKRGDEAAQCLWPNSVVVEAVAKAHAGDDDEVAALEHLVDHL
jgi:hypothetical protein